MDPRQAERLTLELSGVFARRGMVIWAVATILYLLVALQDIDAAKHIPVKVFAKTAIVGLAIGALLGTVVCSTFFHFRVGRSMSLTLGGAAMVGGVFGAIQGLILGANLPAFLSIYPSSVVFRPAQQRAIVGAVLGTISCYLLSALCRRPVASALAKNHPGSVS